MTAAIDYLNPDVPASLPWHEPVTVVATNETLAGYGRLVDDRHDCEVEIVTWPAAGWRPVDAGTGNEGGTVSGIFEFEWRGEILYGRNHAVGGHYILGYARNPGEIEAGPAAGASGLPGQVLLWHANYHPDGGQLFVPTAAEAFVTPLALPGDDVTPDDFVNFYVPPGKGLYIHPGVWHEGVFPIARRAEIYDEQGRIHARVSCNFAEEFGVFLAARLAAPD